MGERLYEFWLRFRDCFTTRTRHTSANAYNYLRGQLTMDNERNFARHGAEHDGRRRPSLAALYVQLAVGRPSSIRPDQAEIKATAALAQGSTLILDESADEKAGTHNAGASRQYNGRMGKVDLCRVDTC